MTQEPMLLGGRYELSSVIGRGGMAEVWRATDTRLSREVAVKRLRVDLATDPSFQARFRKEAQAAAGLNHPNIVSVYDTGEEQDASGIRVPYIVMELVEGLTLRDILRDGRKILPHRALEFTAGVLDALSYSHKMGIVHRDIKPANVMLTKSGVVKVMDFGIARAVADTSATMTQTAAVIGTAQYLSPEQARGEQVDNRSDLYSTGCLLYELLTSKPPFQGDSPVSVAYQHVREMPEPPSAKDAEITSDMDTVTLKALAKNPDDRYQTAKEFRDDITRILDGTPVRATVPTTPPPSVSGMDAPTQVLDPPTAPIAPPRVVVPARAATPVTATMVQSSAPTEITPARAEPVEDKSKKKMSGGVIALLILVFLLLATLAFGIWRFTQSGKPDQVSVPSLSGQNELMAKSTLEGQGLQLGEISYTNGADDQTVGLVVDQDPKAQQLVDKNSKVNITINQGPKKGMVPEVVGLTKDDAIKKLEASGFTDFRFEDATNEKITDKKDQVTEIVPAAGTSQRPETQITLKLATGMSQVPNLVGKTEAQATETAKELGFEINVIVKEPPTTWTEGKIFSQEEVDGSKLLRPGPITVYVAKNPPTPTETPTPPPPPTTPTESPDPEDPPESPSEEST